MGKRTILIIDDEPGIIRSIGKILIKAGYNVISALDGIQATHVAIKEKPDLIILDIHMPAGTGHKVAARLRENFKTAAIPIIILSGSVEKEDRKKAEDLGVDRILSKPFDPNELVHIVKDILA